MILMSKIEWGRASISNGILTALMMCIDAFLSVGAGYQHELQCGLNAFIFSKGMMMSERGITFNINFVHSKLTFNGNTCTSSNELAQIIFRLQQDGRYNLFC
jgi:hypothetical protein